MYLIGESELPGFNTMEIQIIANVARYHRKREPSPHHEAYMKLEETVRSKVSRLAAIHRIADALDREHTKRVKSIKVILGQRDVILKLFGTGDMMLEMWALGKKGQLFNKVFNLKVKAVVG